MSPQMVVALLVVLFWCGMTWLVRSLAYPDRRHFRYDKHNPARRWCKHCNQLQTEWSRTWGGTSWWEDCCPVPDETCICHRYTENQP